MKLTNQHRLTIPTGRPSRRQGAILVWFVLMLPLLLGMTGLVIDGGLLMATHRQAQNSVDAASMAAAYVLLNGGTPADATQTANQFVTSHHGLNTATVEVQTPPSTGPYAGESGYVEVIASIDSSTFFIHLLRGDHREGSVRARSVAGSEAFESIDGIIALDPRAVPGLAVTGNAELNVTGRVIVNSEGGGLGADGSPVGNGNGGSAAFASAFGMIKAQEAYLVGGVNRIDRFQNIEPGGPNPVRAGQLPVADPLAHLPTPTIANGVVDAQRGAPRATEEELLLNAPGGNGGDGNYIEVDPSTGEQTMVLRPGIYSSIDIEGGKVRFEPGIYVVAAPADRSYSTRIVGGEVEADGVMFYNTDETYDPVTGGPDVFDGATPPPDGGEKVGRVRINSALGFSPIDTSQHSYSNASPAINDFNGMLFYQRRRKASTLQIQGFSGEGDVSGTIYAKWGQAHLPAGGTFNSQFIVGSMRVPGHGKLTINHIGRDIVEAPQVYLVE